MTEVISIKGEIINFVSDKMFAAVETEFGIAYLDISDALDYRLQIGDKIEVTETGWYVLNGSVITVLGYKYRLNGNLIKIST